MHEVRVTAPTCPNGARFHAHTPTTAYYRLTNLTIPINKPNYVDYLREFGIREEWIKFLGNVDGKWVKSS